VTWTARAPDRTDLLQDLAAELQANRDHYGMAVVNVDAWVESLAEAAEADETPTTAPQAPPQPLCAKPATTRRQSPCDRPAGHRGGCTWQIEINARRAADYETAARETARLRARTAALETRLKRAERTARTVQLENEAMHRPRRTKADENG
jgi:hypothetical protein